MAQTDHFIPNDEIHPIDIAESVANHHEWEFDRVTDDQIAVEVQGQWRNYSITLAWSAREEVLRLICTFDMDPPADRMPEIYETLNLANDQVWDGGFTFWPAQRLMVWRYGLVLPGDAIASIEQIDAMIGAAVDGCEQFYPSFQMAAWGNATPTAALDIAISRAYGRA